MKYETGEKIELLDTIQLDTGLKGSVVGFDIISGRSFVEVRCQESMVWATTNSVTKL